MFMVSALILFGWHAEQCKAQVYKKNKTVLKEYKVNENCDVQLSNKYGNINIISWDKDSVKIIINLNVETKSQGKTDKIFSYIDFDFTNTEYYIIAKTCFKENTGTFWNDVSDMANVIFSSGNNVEIEYEVYMPAKANLKIDNKFGNIYTTDLSGNIDILLSNGDFKANNLSGKVKIDLKFGNCVVNKLSSAKLLLGYSELELRNCGNADINSKSSKISIDKIDELKITDSKRDKYYLDFVKVLNGNSTFSYIYLTRLCDELTFAMKYGGLSVESLANTFKIMDVNADYTDVTVSLNKSLTCNVDVLHNKKTGINFSEACNKNIKTEIINLTNDEYRTSGVIAGNLKTSARVKFVMKYGNLNVNVK